MADETGVGLMADLLDAILQQNRDLFIELNIGNVISRFKKENQILSSIELTTDLHLDARRLSDEPDAVRALGSLIFNIKEYMDIFIGQSESEKRIGSAISVFTKNTAPSNLERLRDILPEVFSIGAVSPEADLENLGDTEKAKRIYLNIFRTASDADPNTAQKIVSELKKSLGVTSVSAEPLSFEFNTSLDSADAIDQLSGVVERAAIPLKAVEQCLAEFGRIPEELNIISRLFGGALSQSTRFGCPPIDSLLRNGIERNRTLLLEGPTGVEKEILSGLFIVEGLRGQGCVIIVSAGCSVHCIRKKLETSDIDVQAAEKEGRLIYVDWYSRHTERVTSIEADGCVIKVSNDLTNLAVGIDMALRKASGHSQIRLVMDMVSPTTVTEGFDRVHDFLHSVGAKMKSAACTGLVLVNQGMHPPDHLGMLEDTFDGTLRIERTVDQGKIQSNIRIVSYAGGAFSSLKLRMAVTGRGLEVSGTEHSLPSEMIPFDHGDEKAVMGLPGIESLSENGLPIGSSFLVWIPSSMVPSDYIKPVLTEAQKEGHAILMVLSSVTPEDLGQWMSENGLSRKGLIDRGLLQIVDWYGQKSAKVLGMEMDEGIIRTSKDLTHLGVGIDMALRKISVQTSSLAVMEVLSPALRMFDIRTVYSFAQSMNAKLASRNFTSFVLLERDAHDSITNAAIEELFDGIIDIRSQGNSLELGILSIRGCHFQPEYRLLTKMRDRLNVDVARKIQDSEIIETLTNHGLPNRLKNLEKELEETLDENRKLESRLKALSEKESEYSKRHSEMLAALSEVEAKLREQESKASAGFTVDPSHREEVARLLSVMDGLMEKLPEDVIDSFARSEDFKLYEKILRVYLGDKE